MLFLEMFSFLLENLALLALHLSGGNFPRPLPASEERELFASMKKGDLEARGRLISHNLRLVAHIVKKYGSGPSEQEDLISVGTVGLIKAVDTFSSERSTRFSTYASRCIENEILMQFRAARKYRNTVYMNDPLDGDKDCGSLSIMDVLSDERDLAEELEHKTDERAVRALVAKLLAGRERIIIELRYGLSGARPRTQQEVATALGISRSYVSRIEKKSLEALRKELERATSTPRA